MSDFGELLQAAEQLTAEFDPSSSSDLPRVERNLHQIVEAGQQLFAKTSRDVGSQDVKAAILLGSRGIDLPSITNKLESISTGFATATEPTEPLRDTDVIGFLRNERENALLSVIEETRHDTFESAERQHWDAVSSEWEADKMRILTALSGANASEAATESFLPRKEQTRIHETTLGVRSFMDSVEMSYADQVGQYNEAITRGGLKPNLAENLATLFPEEKDAEVARMWEMVLKMSNEIVAPNSGADGAKHRTSVAISKAIIGRAKAYLESAFLKFVKNTVFANLQKAQLGGVPGTYHLVRSFLNVKISPHTPGLEDGLVDGVPVWPLIFYCLRCGDVSAAIQAADEAGPGLDEVKKLLEEILSSADKRLSPHAENLVKISYKRSLRSTTDPYKRAVFCVLAACDPRDEHSEVATNLDMYLWLKLLQLRERGEGNEALTLGDFQKQMSEDYGESHFNAFEEPLLYFQVLFLTGQFELAFEFSFRIDRLRAHSVHMCLAMYESGLLLLPNNIQAPLITQATGSIAKRLNIARLVLLYVRKFEDTNPKEALHYFYFLRHLRKNDEDKSGSTNLFMSCVSELVLESREFDMLLGQILADGSRSPGLIDKFQGTNTHRIIELVAEDSESKGMFEDSVKLYDLAKKHDKVIELLNKLLAQVISLPPVAESRRDRLQKQAVDVAVRYRANGFAASEDAAFFLLLDLMTFFDLFHSKKIDEALDIISKIKIIPLAQNEIDSMVATFRMLSDEVRRNIPDILLATMNILFTKHKDSKASAPSRGLHQDGGRSRHQEMLRDQAKAIITFAGMIPYRMPGDTNARLVQMEVLMN